MDGRIDDTNKITMCLKESIDKIFSLKNCTILVYSASIGNPPKILGLTVNPPKILLGPLLGITLSIEVEVLLSSMSSQWDLKIK